MTALLYTWVITTYNMLLPASTTLTIHTSYTSDWCMLTCITKMYRSDMSDPPMAASSKASVASAATCKYVNILVVH